MEIASEIVQESPVEELAELAQELSVQEEAD